MSSQPINDPDKTAIKSKITVTEETLVSETGVLKAEAEAEVEEVRNEVTKLGKGILKYLDGFRAFILRGNVVDLAIGIVIGAAFTAVVNALVKDLITPLIPAVSSNSKSLSNLSNWTVNFSYVSLHVGDFINAVISFLIVAAVLYFFVVQPVNSLMKLYRPKEDAARAMRDCPYCFQSVHLHAVRCPYCTSHLNKEKNHEEKEPALLLPDSLEKLSEKLAENIVRKASAKLEGIASAEAAGSSSEATTKE